MKTLFKIQVRNYLKVILAVVVLANLVAMPVQAQIVLAAGTNCVTSTSAGGTYTVTPCFTAPADGATLTGAQTVTATYTTTGANPGVAKLIYSLNGQYLITDYKTPYSFTLPTTKWVDGSYVLGVSALMKDGFTSQLSSITVTFNNGITTPPVNNNTYTPTSGTTPPSGQPFVLAAAGDGADGALYAGYVTDMVNSWNPNLFLYLGDVYEKGSTAEFYNWYGQSNTFYGRFRSITNPTIGNHEYENGVAPGYFDYWNNVPNYYSYNANGWHFIVLNSNCGLNRDCAVGQAQYNWLAKDLSKNTNVCTIAYFHHPPFNIGPEGYATSMNDMWALMAQSGVDIVLAGHDHDYQRWVPLDGNGNPSPTGITEFVAGGGGHGIQGFTVSDPRLAVGFDTSPNSFGALRMVLNQYGASYQYFNYQGTVLDSGAVPCNGAPVDTAPPSAPTNLTATIASSSQVNLSWNASSDNVGVAGYDLYRNGALLTHLGVVNSYSDTNLTMVTSYSYQVEARDAAGNTSAFSNTASVTMPTVLFSDGFESGNTNAWTSNTGLVVQQQQVYSGLYAARETSMGSTATYASKTLSPSQTDLYYSLAFKILSIGTTSAYLQRFRTSNNAALVGVFVAGYTGKLGYRNDIAAASQTNGPVVTLNVWHQLQTHVHIDTASGAAGLVEVWYDGMQVFSKTESLGTGQIGRIQLGDSSSTNVYDIALDQVAANTSFIDTTDSQSPSVPTGLVATATAPNAVHLTWNAASDNISVTGYDIFRNGSLLTTVGAVTGYDDTPVSPSFAYQYQVRARDAAGNVSGLSSTASVTTPVDTIAPSVTLTSPADGITVNANVVLAADATDNVGIDHVDFLANGVVVGTSDVEGGPYSIVWDSTTVPDGPVTITARAVDSSSNATTSSARTITVYNAAGDTTPPSTPANFTAVAGGSSRADLSWNASTDNVGVVGYDIYRDGTLLTSVGAVTSYSDSSVLQGSTYQYQIQARDAVGNLSNFATPASVTIPAPLFQEGFESGNLSSWTNTGLVLQQQNVLEGQYAVEALSTAGTANWAYTTLGTATNDLYARTWFKVISQLGNVNLLRFRSGTTGSAGAILGVFVSSTGKLGITNDAGGGSTTSTTSVSPGWHSLQAHAHVDPTNGTNGKVEVWLDGAPVSDLSLTLNLGTTATRRVQLGESATNRIYDVLFDEVVYDTSLARLATIPYTTIDSGPFGGVSNTTASFTFSSPTAGATFECSLDSAPFGVCTSPQSYTALVDGSHTFAVRATAGSVDPTPASRTWTVDTTAPKVTSTIPAEAGTDVALTANVNATFSEAMNAASLTTSSFTLVQQSDGTPISANVTYNSGTNTATLQLLSPLAYSTTYLATVKGGAGGAADAIGNPLAADVTWSFTTIPSDTTPPTVSVTAPLEGAIVSGSVALVANATDNVAVDHVDFLVNGTVAGTATGAPYTVNWNSTTLPNGTASISAHAVDASGNAADSTAITVTIANDVTPPSVPTNLAANAVSSGQVDLTWATSTDDVGVTGYDIFRNGSFLQTVGAVTSYSDKTVAPSLTYQYQVQARDAAGNVSGLSSVASVTTSTALFMDHFETGDLSGWTNNGLVVQGQEVYAGLYAARATTSGAATFAQAQLSTGQYDLYYDIHFKILAQDPVNSIYLLRFKKADTFSALGIYVSSTGKLGYRNDIDGTSNTSTTSVTLKTWHEIQAHIHIDSSGGPGLVEVWYDGAQVQSQAEALNNAPVTAIQLGDNAVGRIYDVAFDNVTADLSYINPGDTQAPTAPTNLAANASSSTRVDLTWSAATDDFGVTGYDLFRNGTLLTVLGPVTSYSDTSVAPLTSYQYTLRALDAAGNISAASAAASVTTPPDTTLPSVSLISPVNGATFGGTVTLSANASDNVAVDHVDFLVNGSAVGTDKTSPYSISWNSTSNADGSAAVTARAVDTAGNAAVSAETTVTVDNTPPDTTITSGPATITNTASAIFSFTATESGSTFACSLDNAAFSLCTSPASFSGLANGSHTFQVRATDVVGNTDPSPAAWSWTIDTVAPTVTSTTPADRASGVSPAGSIVAVFSEAMNPATVTTTTFFVKPKQGGGSPVLATVTYDPATMKATLQPASTLSAQTTYSATMSSGASGVKDLAGNSLNSNYTWSFTTGALDLTPPSVTLTAPANGAKVRGTVTLSANASDNVAVASVSFLVNGSVVGTDTTSPYSVSWNSASVADGSVTIAAQAVDTSNLTTTTANITVSVDNTPPDTTITSGPTGTVTSTSASFSFTSTETGSTFACSLDGAAFSACTSPLGYSNLSNATHTFQVRATDSVGNVDATPASRTWTVDTVAPTVTITSGPSGSVNSTLASFSFTSSETGSTFACSLDAAAFSACASAINYSNLANGSHTFQVRATDPAGNTGTPASRTWSVDTTAPTGVAITSPANGTTVTGQVTITASASDNVGVASVSFYVDGQLLATDISSPYSTTWNTNKVTKTTHTLYVKATDAAGNTTQSASITVTVK